MRMQFTDEDAVQHNFLNEGQHTVSITKVTEGNSKSGKPMTTVEFTAPNGKTCQDWFVHEFKKKLYRLALATGATPELLKSGEWATEMLQGKKLQLVRTVKGKRTYVDKEGVAREADDFENSYLPLSAGSSASSSFTEDTIPF